MERRAIRRLSSAATLAAGLLVVAATAVSAATPEEELSAARSGTAAFRDVSAATAAGYGLPPSGPLHECIASLDDTGAMGFHYINGDLVGDAVVAPAKPEALVYAPTAGGGRKLVALEYVVFAEAWDAANTGGPPSLFGHEFTLTGQPNRYELPPFYALHAWIWKDNPAGVFSGFDPDVSCAAMPDTATVVAPIGDAAPAAPAGIVLAVGGVWLALGLLFRRRRLISHR